MALGLGSRLWRLMGGEGTHIRPADRHSGLVYAPASGPFPHALSQKPENDTVKTVAYILQPEARGLTN